MCENREKKVRSEVKKEVSREFIGGVMFIKAPNDDLIFISLMIVSDFIFCFYHKRIFIYPLDNSNS